MKPILRDHLICKHGNSFQAFHFLLPVLLFPTNWGTCFSFKANSKGLNLSQKCTVRARWCTCFCKFRVQMHRFAKFTYPVLARCCTYVLLELDVLICAGLISFAAYCPATGQQNPAPSTHP